MRSNSPPASCCLIVGAGPAGLFAAGEIAAAGFRVAVRERNPGPGRKFLVAGKGGLNLTHSEDLSQFASRYRGGRGAAWWRAILDEFSPADLRSWAASLGTETFVGTSGRVFPREMSAGRLLAAWRAELQRRGVVFHYKSRLTGLSPGNDGWQAVFETPAGPTVHSARAVLLALGGASWPETGSDGAWTGLIRRLGLAMTPFAPANCGWLVNWPSALLNSAEGLPLKNITARVPDSPEPPVPGDLVITRAGIEGGPVYRLGPALRAAASPSLELDLKPAWTEERLRSALQPLRRDPLSPAAMSALRLGPAAAALLRHYPAADAPPKTPEAAARRIKSFRIPLLGPGPLDRAISTAGGVAFACLDDWLMARDAPGLFFAGEMLDWEAPTGGYLLQGCFSTAARAARGVLRYLRKQPDPF